MVEKHKQLPRWVYLKAPTHPFPASPQSLLMLVPECFAWSSTFQELSCKKTQPVVAKKTEVIFFVLSTSQFSWPDISKSFSLFPLLSLAHSRKLVVVVQDILVTKNSKSNVLWSKACICFKIVSINSHLIEDSPSKSLKLSAMLTESNISGSFF